jgi:hypothetical protein
MRIDTFSVRHFVLICLFANFSFICFSQSENTGYARVETGVNNNTVILNEPVFTASGTSKTIEEPLNIQCRVFEVIKEPNKKLTCKALSMHGDTVHLKFSWRGRYSSCPVKKGTWISVYADSKDEKNLWVRRKIKVNN